jgi:hypothetical protein
VDSGQLGGDGLNIRLILIAQPGKDIGDIVFPFRPGGFMFYRGLFYFVLFCQYRFGLIFNLFFFIVFQYRGFFAI